MEDESTLDLSWPRDLRIRVARVLTFNMRTFLRRMIQPIEPAIKIRLSVVLPRREEQRNLASFLSDRRPSLSVVRLLLESFEHALVETVEEGDDVAEVVVPDRGDDCGCTEMQRIDGLFVDELAGAHDAG